jgi:hypothetical protein
VEAVLGVFGRHGFAAVECGEALGHAPGAELVVRA